MEDKFWTNGAKTLLKAKQYTFENALCTLNKFYYNFFEGRENFDDLEFEEVKSYLECVIEDFKTFKTIKNLHFKFEDISEVEN